MYHFTENLFISLLLFKLENYLISMKIAFILEKLDSKKLFYQIFI